MWSDVLALTEEMLVAARARDFDRVSSLEAARRALLAEPIAADAGSASLLSKIIERDRLVIDIVGSARRFAGEQLRQVRHAQAGAGSYLDVALSR